MDKVAAVKGGVGLGWPCTLKPHRSTAWSLSQAGRKLAIEASVPLYPPLSLRLLFP